MPVLTFEGFTLETIDLPEARLRVRHGGCGPPVLLLHGHPRTHATWHRVAPLLAGSTPRSVRPCAATALVQAADDAGPCAQFEAGDGRRLHRPDAAARP